MSEKGGRGAWLRTESFSTSWNGYATDEDAKVARDRKYRELKKLGYGVSRRVLRNQLRQYAGVGQPDGRVCDVFQLDVYAS